MIISIQFTSDPSRNGDRCVAISLKAYQSVDRVCHSFSVSSFFYVVV